MTTSEFRAGLSVVQALGGDVQTYIDSHDAAEIWESDSVLRAEFNNNFSAYVAYQKAEKAGKTKVFSRKPFEDKTTLDLIKEKREADEKATNG